MRVDLAALADRRAIPLVVVTTLGLSLPFIARGTFELWSDLSWIPQSRLLGRLALFFLFLGCYPLILLLTRIGLSKLTTRQHRTTLTLYPVMTSMWKVLLVLDGFLLIAWPELVALPSLPLDIAISVASAATTPLLWFSQSWFHGFEPEVLRRSGEAFEETPARESLKNPIDTLDYRVLSLVADAGGNSVQIMVNDMGLGRRDLMLRLRKLCAFGYLELVDDMHGPQLTLTTLATDALALPVSLFTWDTDDTELLRDLATARMALEQVQPQKVVVVCARTCERMLRSQLAREQPELTESGGKPLEKATLGDSIGTCRKHKLLDRFSDSIFSAVNERRKKIHDLEQGSAIDELDAFILYTLTEIGARALLRGR